MSLVAKIYNENCLDTMSVMSDCFIDLIFTDPPYGLGSKIIIRPDGKPDYAKASDFMDKWDMPTGKFWETWFAEAFRILKFGGHCLMFGMDRQLLIYKYYANLAGFNENQSLYWYQAQGFPKSSDLSKNLEKNFNLKLILGSNIDRWIDSETVSTVVNQLKKSQIDVGIVMEKNCFVQKSVIMNTEEQQPHLSIPLTVQIVGWKLDDIKSSVEVKLNIVVENVNRSITQLPLIASLVDNKLQDLNQTVGQKNFTVQKAVQINLIEKILDRIKDVEAQKIWNGKRRYWKQEDISVLCAELTDNLLHTILSYALNIQNLDMMFQMDSVFVTRVTITNSTREDLIISMESMLVDLLRGKLISDKYSGYKYSIAPLKQTNETILVFQKPYKTGSCMHDILAMESGDKIITCGALDIDGGRVPTKDKLGGGGQKRDTMDGIKDWDRPWRHDEEKVQNHIDSVNESVRKGEELGRYPSQVFCNNESAELIDKQSGVSKSAGGRIGNKDGALNRLGKTGFTHEYEKGNPGFGDVGGASKILHKCNFEPEELGDKTITCGALNIDGGRVPTNDELGRMQKSSPLPSEYGFNDNSMGGKFQDGSDLGRYPAQTFCNDESAELLDKQSGIKTSCKSKSVHPAYGDSFKFGGGVSSPENQYSDTGGCSKVLHKCNFEPEELKEVGCSSSGDSTITCGALNIDGGRVPIDKIRDKSQLRTMVRGVKEEKDVWGINNNKVPETLQVVREDGRYPSQTFCNSDASEILDNQSGERPSGKSNNNAEVGVSGNATPLRRGKLVSRNDAGGCSKVLDRCDYENEEYDIYNYCPKVSSKERGDSKHPTMKPISLITKILKLFITPNQQVVYDPFTGTGSTGIACVTHKRNFIGSEISEQYCKIAEKRIADAKYGL